MTILRKISIFAAVLIITSVFPAVSFAKQDKSPFSDVAPDFKYFLPIKYLKENNFIHGFSDGTFHPEREVSRAEALSMILKATNVKLDSEMHQEASANAANPLQITLPPKAQITVQNLTTGEKTTFSNIQNLRIETDAGTAKLKIIRRSKQKPFNDVSEKDWFFDIAREAKRLNIIKSGKYFRPNQPTNLAETLRMLFQSAGIKTDLESSVMPAGIPADAWYAKDIAYAASRTMIAQQEDGAIFPPDKNLNRGEIALLLYRFLKTQNNITFGYASWYGDGLAKTKLTEGLEYKEKSLTAAHKTFPFGTILRVTNISNGKQVNVVVNDRGPFVTGRIIDLSKTAFSALESTSAGIISVQIEPLK